LDSPRAQVQKFNLTVSSPFALYEAAEANGKLCFYSSNQNDQPCAIVGSLRALARLV
jgi:hypothetical protein